MDIVSSVATWAGLILGISSTVLAIVTIGFARATDDRSERISVQTITSLQRIEGIVERLSQDTNGLIKAAWDKMLQPGTNEASTNQELVARSELELALQEIRAELETIKPTAGQETETRSLESITKTVENLERNLHRQSRELVRSTAEQTSIGALVRLFEGFSTVTVELARALFRGGRHLTKHQIDLLMQTPLGAAIIELRDNQLIAPFQSATAEDGAVFWFAGQTSAIETALTLVGRQNHVAQRRVSIYLRKVGYLSDSDDSPTEEGHTSEK